MSLLSWYMVRLFGAPREVGARTEWAYTHRTRASIANALLFGPAFAAIFLVTGLGLETTAIGLVVFATFFFVSIYVAMWWRSRSGRTPWNPTDGPVRR